MRPPLSGVGARISTHGGKRDAPTHQFLAGRDNDIGCRLAESVHPRAAHQRRSRLLVGHDFERGRRADSDRRFRNRAGSADAGRLGVPSTGPRWTGRAGTVILQRARLRSEYLIIDGLGPPSPPFVAVVDARDLSLPTGGDVDVGLMRHGEDFDIDLRLLRHRWASGKYRSDDRAVGNHGYVAGNSARTLSSHQRVHRHLRHAVGQLRGEPAAQRSQYAHDSGGLRYLYFRDQFAASVDSGMLPQSSRVAYSGNNDLFGSQIGADGVLSDSGNRFALKAPSRFGRLQRCRPESRLAAATPAFAGLDAETSGQTPTFRWCGRFEFH